MNAGVSARVRRSRARSAAIGVCLVSSAVAASTPPASAETRGFVVSMIHTATYGHQPDTCPMGGNGGPRDFRIRRLIASGLSKEEAIKKAAGDGQDDVVAPVPAAARPATAGAAAPAPAPAPTPAAGPQRGGGGPSPGNFPTSVPDPKIEIAKGRFAYGFNLNGKIEPDSFIDPESEVKGVDNALWRIVGCFTGYDVMRPVRPYSEDIAWDTALDSMPAWLVSITGDDLSKDGPVTVTFDRALNVAMRDTRGGLLSAATYTIDPDPRSHSVLKGRIKDQTLIVEGGDFAMQGESQFYAVLRFTQTHLRFKMAPDGSMDGIIGGYQPYRDLFHFLAIRGEGTAQVDLPGVYYAMKRYADGVPDKAGEKTAISTAYYMEAVPAFHTTVDGKVAATSVGPGPALSGPAVKEQGR